MINCYEISKEITLKEFLKDYGLSNAYIYKLEQAKAITNNNGYIKSSDILKKGNIYINFSLLESNDYNINTKSDIEVIYENQDIIAVFKRRGILVHSDGGSNNTLLDEVGSYLLKKGDDSVLRAVHRLDVDTTGIVIFSKNILSHAYLSNLMERQLINKEYHALVEGVISKDGSVDIGIGKNRHDSKKMIALKSGKPSFTEYSVLKINKNTTLLKVKIKTGRTHQIRVHMSYINHPVVGDSLYGKGDKLMLMCKRMSFDLFGKKTVIETKNELV